MAFIYLSVSDTVYRCPFDCGDVDGCDGSSDDTHGKVNLGDNAHHLKIILHLRYHGGVQVCACEHPHEHL